jgi:hypothetical protein
LRLRDRRGLRSPGLGCDLFFFDPLDLRRRDSLFINLISMTRGGRNLFDLDFRGLRRFRRGRRKFNELALRLGAVRRRRGLLLSLRRGRRLFGRRGWRRNVFRRRDRFDCRLRDWRGRARNGLSRRRPGRLLRLLDGAWRRRRLLSQRLGGALGAVWCFINRAL